MKGTGIPIIIIGLLIMSAGIASAFISLPSLAVVNSKYGYFEVTSYSERVDLNNDYAIIVNYKTHPTASYAYFCIGTMKSTDDLSVTVPEGIGITSSSSVKVEKGKTSSFVIRTSADTFYYGKSFYWKVSMWRPSGWGPPWELVEADFVDLLVTFNSPNYKLTMSTNNSDWGTTAPSGTTYWGAGSPVVITAHPKVGIPEKTYKFSHWSGDIDVSLRTQNPTQIVMDRDRSIMANFLASATYTLTTIVGSGEGTVKGGGTYSEGTIVQIEAIPAKGYIFERWGGSITGTENPTTITIDGNKTVYAYFKTGTYKLKLYVTPSGTGTTKPEADKEHVYSAQSSVVIEAIPKAGHTFSCWIGDFTGTTNPATIIVDKDKTIGAMFDVRSVPEADFSYTPSNPTIGQTVYFTDLSKDYDGYIRSWYWTFGSGANPSSSTETNPTVIYSIGGSKTVKLTVIDDGGASNTAEKGITVTEVPTYKLSGYVIDANTKEGINGVLVKVDGRNTTTNTDGYFLIEGLINKTYVCLYTKEGHIAVSDSITISGADETVTIQMKQDKGIIGNINWTLVGIGFMVVLGGSVIQTSTGKKRRR